VERKWIDNVLSRVDIAGAESSGHGIVRRLTIGAVRHIALTQRLVQDFGFTIERAASLAGRLIEGAGEVRGPSGIMLRVDLSAFEADIDRRLADGVEAVVLARRGRPPRPPR
jgi:hypothetical protein